MIWKERNKTGEYNQSVDLQTELPEQPQPTQVQEPLVLDPETQKLHDAILSELHEVTANYVNIPDPIESAAR